MNGLIKPSNQMLNHLELHPKPHRHPRTAGRDVASFVAFLVAVCLTSCVPVENLIYLQPDGDTTKEVFEHDIQEYKLQINDILDVKISSLNPEVNAIFNASSMGTMQVAQASAQTGGDLYYITGYSVTAEGYIDIPFVGKVDVEGLTLSEAHKAVDERVRELFTNYHLQVKMGGILFTALGEFNRPVKHVVMQNQVTIFEAIALGGDLSLVGNREQVKLIRQHPEGTRIHQLNLLEEGLVGSPLYFIQPNDVIYVEPLKQRSWGVGVTGAETVSQIIGALSTTIALTLSILSLSQ